MFSKKNEQIIKFEQNADGISTDEKGVLFVRVKSEVNSKDAMFEVPESHIAYVIKGGGDKRFYQSGTYDVFDDKKDVKAWKRGASVDIVYIPKETNLIIAWGTPVKFKYRDFSSKHVVNIGANGQFRIEIKNPEQFMRKVVGPLQKFVLRDFQKEFLIDVTNEFRDVFLNVVQEEKLTYDQFDSNLKSIGNKVGDILSSMFEKSWGIGLVNFYIKEIVVEDEDMEAIDATFMEKKRQEKEEEEQKRKSEHIKEVLAELERLDDKQWEREKYLRQLELQDKAAYYEVMKVIGKSDKKDVSEKLQCPVCGTEYKSTDKFCPNCGKRVSKDPIICPDCGHSNSYTSKFCGNCGKPLVKEDK